MSEEFFLDFSGPGEFSLEMAVGLQGPKGDTAGLEVAESPVDSGIDTRVLFNNNGKLGEYAVSGSGNVAMTTDPAISITAQGSSAPRVLSSRFADEFNILDFGATEGSGDSTSAIQSAIDEAIAAGGKLIRIPPGEFFIDELVLDLETAGAGFGAGNRIQIVGSAMGLSVLRSAVTGTDKALSIIGDYAGASGQANFSLRDFSLLQLNTAQAGRGLDINGVSYVNFESVRISGFDRGINAVDSISNYLRSCQITHNNRGVAASRGSFSYPNAWTFIGNHINANKNIGLIFDCPANLNILGGDISLNGEGGGSDCGIYINGNPVEGEKGLDIRGTYMEGNHGSADIIIDANSGTSGAHYISVGHYRINASNYVTNHILLNKAAAGETRVTVDTSTFSGYNGYTANASRKAIAVGSEFDSNYCIELRNNRFWSLTEKPTVDGVKVIDRIPFLTGDVTTDANFAATLKTAQSAVHTWGETQTFTKPPVFTDASGSRTALGLGTAAVKNTGTSGDVVPLLNTANTWSANQAISAASATITLNAVTGAPALVFNCTVAGNGGSFTFRDAGSNKWGIGMDGSNNLYFYDVVGGKSALQATVATSLLFTDYSFLALAGTAIPAGGITGAGMKLSATTNFGIFFGSGAPTLSAAQGSLYLRSDGAGVNSRLYVNTDGSTTWTSITSAS